MDIFLYPDVLYRADLSGQLLLFDFHGVTRNYPVLLMICILMLLVYILIFYTFQTAGDAMERERIAGNMKRADPAAEKAVRILSAKKRGREDFSP